jgi:thiol-disulfide isomerase/thioredoxin
MRPPATNLYLAAIAALAAFTGIYVTFGRPDNGDPGIHPDAARESAPVGDARPGAMVNELSRGTMAAFVFKRSPEVLPDVRFEDASASERSLAQWRGKVVLLNLWATWCLPCRKEMPALDRLEKELGSDRFEVVAVSVDRAGLTGARKFLADTQVEQLKLYADPSARLAAELRAVGLPATLLIDAEGREVGRLLGGAAWDSEDAKRLVRSLLR